MSQAVGMATKEWRDRLFVANGITEGEPTHGFRYIVGTQAESLDEAILAVSVNAAAALIAVAQRWGSGLVVQVLDIGNRTLYTFDTEKSGEPPLLLELADEVKLNDSKGAPWE